MYRLQLSRDWISRTGPRRHRHTTVVFVLRKHAVVEFVVQEIAPECRRVARFRVAGRPGVNRVRLGARIGRKVLGPGSYRLLARTLPGGRTVVDTRLVVVQHPSSGAIEAGRGADACQERASSESSAGATATAGRSGRAGPTAGSEATTAKASRPRHHGVLGARFVHEAEQAVGKVPLWLYALLAVAIALLGVAALPSSAAPRRMAAPLARRRPLIALAGAGALVVVTLAYTLH